MQGPRAADAVVEALRAICAEPEVDVVVLARGGGSFDDLLPFSDERVVRAVAGCPVPVVSAVGHEQDTPLCDLAADVRASTPTAAARLVVPDLDRAARLARTCAGRRSDAARGARSSATASGSRPPERRLERAAGLARRAAPRRRRALGGEAARALPARDARARLRDRPSTRARSSARPQGSARATTSTSASPRAGSRARSTR